MEQQEEAHSACDIERSDVEERRKVLISRIEDVISHLIGCLVRDEKPSLTYEFGKKCHNANGKNTAKVTQIDTPAPSSSISQEQEKNDNPEAIRNENGEESFDLNSMMNCEPFSEPATCEDADARNKREKTIRFSGLESRKRFAIIMKVLTHVHANLIKYRNEISEEFYITKRAFYYALKNQDVKRFVKRQSQVDSAINEVTLILECAPWEIGFISTSKGLIAGKLTLHFGQEKVITYVPTSCQAVPDVMQNVTQIRTTADYVLVVEKDSAFQRLMREGCPAFNNCILVTGKGYPDVQTRMLVRLLSERMDLPVYALVDPDPHGFEIMCMYRFGTLNNLGYREQLICPKMRWLGIHQVDLLRLGIQRVKLTDRESKKIGELLNRSYANADFSKHLRQMKLGKAEIESFDKPAVKHFLSEYFIPNKIRMKEYY